MSYYEGLSCPVCAKAFTADEDIVVCPQCGLPHHRTCWKSVGQCYEHDKHGTAKQWHRNNAKASEPAASVENICPRCHAANAQYAEFCSRCGYELTAGDWHSVHEQNFSYQHTVYSAESDCSEVIDDVSVNDLTAMVGSNTDYYLPRFRRMSQGGSGGWNWSAFLLSPYWLFYRKQYLLGSIYLGVFLLMNIVCSIISFSLPVETDAVAMQLAAQEMQNHVLFYPCMALVYIWLAMIVLLAIKGNAFYFSHCKRKVATLRQKTPDISAHELCVGGGVSVGMTVLIVVVTRIGVVFVANLLYSLI